MAGALFPFTLPFPTAFYLTLYVLTFAMHQAFMHYVLAGSLYVAWTMAFPGSGKSPNTVPRSEQPLALILRDWMPFLLSAAITAGVAPLLFIQIVYQRQFYTGNLLLFWRWMAVVPVLIVAFYLLYLIKSHIMDSWSRALRASVAILTAGCFVFVGFCWTVNYLIGINEANWPEIYATGILPIAASTILNRMVVWIGISFASMSAIAAWQLQSLQLRSKDLEISYEIKRLARMSQCGLIAMFIGGFGIFELKAAGAHLVIGREAILYLLLTLMGITWQFRGWWAQLRFKQIQSSQVRWVSAGAILTLLGICFMREAIRADRVNLASQYQKHAEAAKVGGFVVFLIFTVLVTIAILWCLRIVQQGLAQTEGQE